MAGRDLVPATTKNPPFGGEKLAQGAKAPILSGAGASTHNPLVDHRAQTHPSAIDHRVHTPMADHSLRPSHELDLASVKPLSLRSGMTARGHPMSGERGFFSSDESALNKQIQATHAPDMEDINVRPILTIIEDILRLARPSSEDNAATAAIVTHGGAHTQAHPHLDDKVSHGAHHEEKPYQTSYRDEKAYLQPSPYHEEKASYHNASYLEAEIVKVLAYPINKVSCEIVCKSGGGGESHQVTMDLLKSLASYTWDAKIVIAFAAFAINYGEFWLVEHLHTKNPLAKNIATLKDLPDTLAVAGGGDLRKQFDAVIDLLNEILKVTHCIIQFKELPPLYISTQSPEITAATAHIPSAVYWCIRGLLVCASTLLNLIGGGHEYITTPSVSWEILNLAHKLKVILDHLQTQMKICMEIIERKKFEDAYIRFKRLLETAHIDNMRVLTEMFRFREDQRPLYDGSRRTNEQLTALKMKYVLLLISDLDLPQEELHVLHLIHNERTVRHDYEVLWVPIIAPGRALDEKRFYELRNNMPWYSAEHPSLVNPVVIRYAREELKFTHRPMLVVLDPHGKLSNHDALPMMWIWGAKAFPFTKDWERKLWEESYWNIELIADHIDPRIQEWISANKVICLYGGDDIVWIRSFTVAARAAARAMGVTLEMLYVGKRNPREKVRQCHEMIARENLSHIFPAEYHDYVWYFWERLASMWNSKKQIGRTVEDDIIMKGILDLLTFDSSDQGWAVFSRGNFDITMAIGEKALHVIETYADWAYEVDHPDKFVPVLHNHFAAFHPAHHCNRLILPGHAGYIPETVVCTECDKTMDKYVMYRCCTD